MKKFYLYLLVGSMFLVISFSYKDVNRAYYAQVNQANQNIYLNDFAGAKTNLENAFKENRQPYYHDIYKLIYCNSKLEIVDENLYLIKKLIHEKNVNPKLLKYQLNGLLTPLEIDSLNSYEYQEINSSLKKTLLELYDYDQSIRDYSECREIEDSKLQRKCFDRKFAFRDSIDAINAISFLKILNQYGIPSEDDLGVYLRGSSFRYNTLFFILGIHFLQTDSKEKIIELYKKGLEEGKFHPELYASVYDFMLDNAKVSPGRKFLSTTVNIVDKKWYKPFIYYTESNMDSINRNRNRIGLDSFHIFQKQVVSDLICKKGGKIIPIISYPRYSEYPAGIVELAFKKENMDLKPYEIGIDSISIECNCQNRVF